MNNPYKNKYNIIIIGSGFFASHLAVHLAKTNLSILLISQEDFGNSDDNFIVEISKQSKIREKSLFYSTYSHSVIPVSIYNIENINTVDGLSRKIQSFVSKKVINSKSYNKIENAIKVNKNSIIKIGDRYKINYSRLCVDTAKTAKNKGADIINSIKINNIKSQEINLVSGDKIEADLIINTDYSLLDNNLKSQASISISKLIRIPKNSLNINNPIRINNSSIDLVPYFSEVFIHSRNNDNIEKITNQISENIEIEISSKVIIEEKTIKNYSSEIIKYNNSILNIFESDYSKFKEKTISILKEITNIFSLEPVNYKEFKIAGSYNENIDKFGFVRLLEDSYLQIQETGISPNEYTVLFYRYGTDIEKITDKAYDFYNDKQTRKHAWLYAELWYSVNYEFVKTPEGFIERRTNFGLLNQLDKEKKEIISNFIENFNNAK